MQYHIEGMDCASCVGKIERALMRIPGVSEVQLNFATQKLELTLAPDTNTGVKDIEKTITAGHEIPKTCRMVKRIPVVVHRGID